VTETNVFQLSQPGTFTDQLTEILRNGARALLAQADPGTGHQCFVWRQSATDGATEFIRGQED
jgi:hypothetical protein